MSEIVRGYLGLWMLLFLAFGSACLLSASADAANASAAADRYMIRLEQEGDSEEAVEKVRKEAEEEGYEVDISRMKQGPADIKLTLRYSFRLPLFHLIHSRQEVRIR